MRKSALLVVLFLPVAALGQVMRGRVVMPDGSAPPQRAVIERWCRGGTPIQETVAGKRGDYFWRIPDDNMGMRLAGIKIAVPVPCYLRARIKGMESNTVDIYDPAVRRNLDLPPLVLRPANPAEQGPQLPEATLKVWQAAVKAYQAGEWKEAEALARTVAKTSPQFASAWLVAGGAAFGAKRLSQAREAFERAIATDPKSLPGRLQLLRVEIALEQWADAAGAADALIGADTARRYPEAYLNRGIARYMRNDAEGARSDWKLYLELAPSSSRAASVRAKLEALDRETKPAPVSSEMLTPAEEPEFKPGIAARIPGGRKALARMAHLKTTPAADDFFLEYCRVIAEQASRRAEHPIPGYSTALQIYLSSVADLAALGDSGAISISLGDPKSSQALALLGWRVTEREGKRVVEPGENPIDSFRQQIPRALGIDEFAMQQALQSGRAFEFAIETESAPVTGGTAWNVPLASLPPLSAGIAEAFVRDPRLARAYAGLAAMPPEVSTLLVKSVGLRTLSTLYSDTLWQLGDALARPLPGGPAAEPVWTKLAGASPRDPARFAEALLRADRGRVGVFYAAVSQTDTSRQRYFTKDVATAERLYRWFHTAEDPARRQVMQTVPLDGGELADDVEAAAAVAKLEVDRGAAFDKETARLIGRYHREWRPLVPYFTAFPRLGLPEVQALESFTRGATDDRLGAWYAAAELIALGRRAGSLDAEAASTAFAKLCRSGDAVAIVREIAGGGADLDEAVATRLLRLSGDRRAAFDRIRELQNAPRLSERKAGTLALAGAVYGAVLDPSLLVLHEDRDLLRHHEFSPQGPGSFAPSAFAGSRFTGGLMSLVDASAKLARIGRDDAAPAANGGTAADFRASARLVEIYATVTDDRGRRHDGLRPEQFAILDRGASMNIAAFENETAAVSVALLLDTSQSMDTAVGALKSGAMRLIAGLRLSDSVAVYSLTGGITELQSFTTNKDRARRAVLHAELGELTGLYDGLVRVNRDLSARTGKKAIIVFTDGEDTASALSLDAAVYRAKTAGVPIYTIAQGHAARHPELERKLAGISEATGGLSFPIRSNAEISPVFDRVLQDLLHGYLLAFSPRDSDSRVWRPIEVRLRAPLRGRVRARQGYYPE